MDLSVCPVPNHVSTWGLIPSYDGPARLRHETLFRCSFTGCFGYQIYSYRAEKAHTKVYYKELILPTKHLCSHLNCNMTHPWCHTQTFNYSAQKYMYCRVPNFRGAQILRFPWLRLRLWKVSLRNISHYMTWLPGFLGLQNIFLRNVQHDQTMKILLLENWVQYGTLVTSYPGALW